MSNNRNDDSQSINYLVKRSNINSSNVKFIQFVEPYYKRRCCEWFDGEQPVSCLKNFLEMQFSLNASKSKPISLYFLNSKIKVSDIFPLNEHRTDVIQSIIKNSLKNVDKKDQCDQPNLKLLDYSTKLRNVTTNPRAIIIYDLN